MLSVNTSLYIAITVAAGDFKFSLRSLNSHVYSKSDTKYVMGEYKSLHFYYATVATGEYKSLNFDYGR
jgi:hypothetical protein